MVIVETTTKKLQELREKESSPVAFVPTMGNLHLGHLSLLRKALEHYQTVFFSIFVNPKQFGPKEDFQKYPRTLENDLKLIRSIDREFPSAKIIIFAPGSPEEIYPPGYDQRVEVKGLSSILEGAIRPGHFEGVATVVHRLFEIVRPHEAYFGLKDYQQYLVIRNMVKDLLMPVKVTGMPIIRDEEGLALSSRNQYLSSEEKKEALILSRTLRQIERLLSGKKSNLSKTQVYVSETVKDKKWNYLELRDAETLSEDISNSDKITVLGVYQLGSTRLLDNIQLEMK